MSGDMRSDTDVTLQRLEDQIAWYDSRSGSNQRMFKRLKISMIAGMLVTRHSYRDLSAAK